LDIVTFRRAKSINDFNILRKIRNTGFEYLTNHSKYLSLIDQYKFYLKKNEYSIFILTIKKDIGYLLLKENDKKYFITIVLTPNYRGKGIAKLVIDYFKNYYKTITAVINKNNKNSLNLFIKCGFQLVLENNENLIYEYEKK